MADILSQCHTKGMKYRGHFFVREHPNLASCRTLMLYGADYECIDDVPVPSVHWDSRKSLNSYASEEYKMGLKVSESYSCEAESQLTGMLVAWDVLQ